MTTVILDNGHFGNHSNDHYFFQNNHYFYQNERLFHQNDRYFHKNDRYFYLNDRYFFQKLVKFEIRTKNRTERENFEFYRTEQNSKKSFFSSLLYNTVFLFEYFRWLIGVGLSCQFIWSFLLWCSTNLLKISRSKRRKYSKPRSNQFR